MSQEWTTVTQRKRQEVVDRKEKLKWTTTSQAPKSKKLFEVRLNTRGAKTVNGGSVCVNYTTIFVKSFHSESDARDYCASSTLQPGENLYIMDGRKSLWYYTSKDSGRC